MTPEPVAQAPLPIELPQPSAALVDEYTSPSRPFYVYLVGALDIDSLSSAPGLRVPVAFGGGIDNALFNVLGLRVGVQLGRQTPLGTAGVGVAGYATYQADLGGLALTFGAGPGYAFADWDGASSGLFASAFAEGALPLSDWLELAAALNVDYSFDAPAASDSYRYAALYPTVSFGPKFRF